jgi:hypothetical protein
MPRNIPANTPTAKPNTKVSIHSIFLTVFSLFECKDIKKRKLLMVISQKSGIFATDLGVLGYD